MRADCDCLPSGHRLQLVSGSHMTLNGAVVHFPDWDPNHPEKPGTDVIYSRLAPDGLRFVGIGNGDDLAWVWDGFKWTSHGLAFGPRAVIFDAAGHLQVIRPPGPAVGYRYVAEDGRLVTANETLADVTRSIWEYTTLGGITIGQGGEGPDGDDPCIAIVDDKDRRLISKGRCRFINVTHDGTLYAVAFVREDTGSSEFLFLTRAQILSMPEPTPITPTPDPIVVIGKDCWCAWFEFNHPPSILPPGNAIVAIRYPAESGTIRDFAGVQFAQWIDGASVEEIEAKAAAATFPPVAYWDSRHWPRWPTLPDSAWLAIQGYCLKDETPAAFEADLRRIIESVPAAYQRIALVCQCYTSNLTLTTNLSGLVPVFARLARDYPRLTMLLPFSDQGRATGLQDHPDVRPSWQTLADGITGTPQHGGTMLDWQKIHEYGDRRWAEMEVNRISWELDPQEKGLCRPFQQKCFVEITSELFHNEKTHLDLFWKAGVPNYDDPSDVQAKLAHIGEDIVADVANRNYRDVVGAMGHPSADWNALGELKPITPGDEARCGPPPEPLVQPPDPLDPPPSGDVIVDILDYDRTVRRSNPNGLLIRFDAQTTNGRPIVKVDLDLLDDGEPSIEIAFSPEPRRDGRYCRALAFKPTVNGERAFVVTAWDDAGNVGKSDGSHRVNVIP